MKSKSIGSMDTCRDQSDSDDLSEIVIDNKLYDGDELDSLYSRDKDRFRKSYLSNIQTADQDQLASRLVFSSHSLEKGLSNDGFEIGHGFMVARLLIEFLNIYKAKNYDKKHLAYMNTISVLGEFYNRHRGTKYIDEINSIFGDWKTIIEKNHSELGGSDEVVVDGKKTNGEKNFRDLAKGRFAVRSYSNKPVSKKDIEDAIDIARKTPTVCNRQPVRVRVMYDKDIIAQVLKVQGGIDHYDTPPVLLLITSDDKSYIGVNERNQGYIDGGLFAMSVLYALEYKKLAACPLHTMFEADRDFKIRGMLNIPDNEKLITFISVGHFNDVSTVCKSFRYPVDSILSEVNKIHDYRVEIKEIPKVDQEIESRKSLIGKVRMKLKLRTRTLAILRRIKHATRIRTRIRKAIFLTGTWLDERKHNYKKADGAILTITGYFNYGNVLQRYALQKFLRQHGKNFISYVDPLSAPRDMYRVSRKTKLRTPLRFVKRLLKSRKPYWYTPKYSELYPEAKGIENLIRFVNNNVCIKPFSPDDNYKTYIVGSDQVWRDWWNDREKLGYYFLNFLNGRKAKRIAYAASFGKDKVEDVMTQKDIEYIKPYVEDFDAISVREKSAIKIIQKAWGLNDATEVVDPTLLLTSTDYSRIVDMSNVRDAKIQPIFTYILDQTSELKDFISRVERYRQQPAAGIRAHAGSEDDVLPPVELWLKGFRDAELVITNSFHGVAFSVINNTDFIVIGKEAGGLSRIKDFLAKYGIDGRFVNENSLKDFDIASLRRIDWDSVNKKLEASRKESGDWLLSIVNR